MSIINRQLSREQDRKKKKLQSWLKSFNEDQKMLWQQTILSEIKKNDEVTMLIIDKCYMAAINDNINLELSDLEKIIKDSSIYMEDYKNKLEKGDMMEMVKSLETKIQSKMRTLIKSGKGKLESIKELEKEYKIPFAELDFMWLQVKSKMGIVNKHTPKKAMIEEEIREVIEETKKDKDKEESLKKIGKNNERILNKDEEIPYSVTEKEIETEQEKLVNFNGVMIKERDLESAREIIIEEKREYNEFGKVEPILTIKRVSETFKGSDGAIYEKSVEGVKTSRRTFKDIKDLDQYKVATQEGFSYQIKELEKKLKEVREKELKELNFINEVGQIFNL